MGCVTVGITRKIWRTPELIRRGKGQTITRRPTLTVVDYHLSFRDGHAYLKNEISAIH